MSDKLDSGGIILERKKNSTDDTIEKFPLPIDEYWGVNRHNGNGKNHLGMLLMLIRYMYNNGLRTFEEAQRNTKVADVLSALNQER